MKRLIVGLAPVLLAIGSSAVAASPAWRISEASGDVKVVESGRSKVALRGALLSSGATIVTGQGARAVIVRDRDFVVISPNSRMRIAEPVQQRGIIQVIADFGTALFRIEHKKTPHFGVQTPYLAAVVKGTVFTVTVGKEGSTVQVTEGAVEVATLDGGAVDLIRPGMIASVGANDRLQLSVKGDVDRVIRSNGAPVAGTVTVPAPAPAEGKGSGGEGEGHRSAEVTNVVHDDPVSLAEVTDGLVQGNPVENAMADANRPAKAREERGASGGSDNGSANGGSGGNGNDGGGTGGSDSGAGGSGGTGSDNGNGGAGGSGNGNGGSGGSGSGNGNGGSGGSGSGNGNGGSGGGADNGNGNGNGNGGSGGGADNGNGGSGNGNGNGGSGHGNGGSGGPGGGSGGSGGSDNSGSGGSGGTSGSGGSGGPGGSDNGGSGGQNGPGGGPGGPGNGPGGGNGGGNGGGKGPLDLVGDAIGDVTGKRLAAAQANSPS